MEFRLMHSQDQEVVQSLWHYCFEKREDPFFQWYFKHYLQTQNVLLGLEGNEVACALHLNPYVIRLRQTRFPVSYIVGLATFPQYRRGGKIRELLAAAFAEQQRRGQCLCLLMPFRGEFYYPYGFEYCYHHLRYQIPLAALKQQTLLYGEPKVIDCRNVKLQEKTVIQHCQAVYEGFSSDKDGMVLREVQDWRNFLGEHFSGDAYGLLIEQDGQPEAYLFYKLVDKSLWVRELAYVSPQGRAAALQYCYNHRSQVENLDWNAPLDDPLCFNLPDPREGVTLYPFMTARILAVATLLEQLRPGLAEGTVTLRVHDNLLSENNQSFRLSIQAERICVEALGQNQTEVEITIGALAQLVFGRLSTTELKKTGQVKGANKALSWLDACFPKQVLYINEYI